MFIVSLIYGEQTQSKRGRYRARRRLGIAFDAGLGEHWVALTPDQKILFPKLNYAYNILNLSCYPLVKLSILLLYLRIFPTPRFRQFCWGGIVFISCMGVANTLVAIFACNPVQGFYDMSVPSTCINDVQFYWATAVLNVVTDLYILLLPMPMVWGLQTTLKRKLAIAMIFVLGGLTFIVSIIRIVYYLDYTSDDPSYSFLGTAYATPAEVCLAVMVASAPTWWPVWTYTVNVAHSLFSRSGGSGESFNLGTAHSHARGVALASVRKPGAEGRVTEAEISRKSSATAIDEQEKNESEKLRDVPSTPASTTPSGPHSEMNSEGAVAQLV